ncbi:MAG: isochorismatase family protein [Pseudomonadales bacterium]|nr:isochorismatase family protein [Pseudomonadales bacterium]
MATIREGNKRALVVVDVQVGVMDSAWDADRVIANVARTVENARANNVPVIWVQHSDGELQMGSDAWQWVPSLTQRDDETVVHKQHECSFEETNLEHALAAHDASHIVLAGAATNWCIRATAYGALDRGYDLTLVSDAHTTGDMDLGNGEMIPARNFVIDLNVAMTWLSYPGRSTTTAKADEIEFAAASA